MTWVEQLEKMMARSVRAMVDWWANLYLVAA